MKYGYFDEENHEYVITNPKLPVRWINYIGTLDFGGFVDHTGGALICKGDPAVNRITKYIPQLPASSFNGETLYLRIGTENGFRFFSPFFTPTLDEYSRFECHVGLGYNRIISEFFGVQSDVMIFVPLGSSVELRDIQITNLTTKPMEIDVIPVIEYSHPDALKQFTNADWVPQTMRSEALLDGNYTILLQYPFMNRDTQVNYFTSNHIASSFETDRRIFLGENEYRNWDDPLALQSVELGNSEAKRGENIAALLHHLGEVQAGQTRRIITQTGQVDDREKVERSVQENLLPDQVDRSFNQLRSFWISHLEKVQIETPDRDMDILLNTHLPRQCYITMQWSRYLSLYQLGFGARGIGYRDSSQDSLGVMSNAPEVGRTILHKLLQVQRQDGSAMHQFNPMTMVANEGDSREVEGSLQYYSDDHLWSVLAICEFLKETGDFDFLHESTPFYEKDAVEQQMEAGTVLEHMRKALEFTQEHTGEHGLPLLGFADWNDTVNLPMGAESLFTANLFGKALLEMIGLEKYLKNFDRSENYTSYYEAMRDKVNEHGWDGDWYLRYIDSQGSPIGSQKNEQGQIFLNAQSWPVISQFAPKDRARKALDSVYRDLNTKAGVKLSSPGYDGYDPDKGGITTYPPGAKENGGIFLHANPWVIIAEAILGNGERAYEYYAQINPIRKNQCIDEYECEPYVFAQNILADEHPQFGLARNSWLTGTAAWAWHAATHFIFGIRPTYHGLYVEPCIPSAWPGFKVRRFYRNAWYEVEVQNPAGICRGISNISVDNQALEGKVIPIFEDGRVHNVVVVLGKDTNEGASDEFSSFISDTERNI